MDRNGPEWTGMDRNGTEMDRNGTSTSLKPGFTLFKIYLQNYLIYQFFHIGVSTAVRQLPNKTSFVSHISCCYHVLVSENVRGISEQLTGLLEKHLSVIRAVQNRLISQIYASDLYSTVPW